MFSIITMMPELVAAQAALTLQLAPMQYDTIMSGALQTAFPGPESLPGDHPFA